MKQKSPLSPHLEIYTLPLTGLISISHRITGVCLSLGLVLFVCVLTAIASGAQSFAELQQTMNMGIVQLIYLGVIYALSFHLCHGIRHLIWDAGASFDKATMDRYATIELGASVVLTLLVLIFY